MPGTNLPNLPMSWRRK